MGRKGGSNRARHDFQDWEGEIRRIRTGLDEVLKELSRIDDDLASKQALAQIRASSSKKYNR